MFNVFASQYLKKKIILISKYHFISWSNFKLSASTEFRKWRCPWPPGKTRELHEKWSQKTVGYSWPHASLRIIFMVYQWNKYWNYWTRKNFGVGVDKSRILEIFWIEVWVKIRVIPCGFIWVRYIISIYRPLTIIIADKITGSCE